jgi:hypothetical protein
MKLYKTIVVIWSDYDPTDEVELEDLARDATNGDAYCSKQHTVLVEKPEKDPDWDRTEFFMNFADEEESEEARA